MGDVGLWTLDPIDGTKGFLRGGQYAVCLALLVDARVELGVIGCPNLPSSPPSDPSSPSPFPQTTTTTNTTTDRGALFIAVRGQGAYQFPLHPPSGVQQQQQRLTMPRLALHELAFLESYEKAHAALDTNALVASRLGVRAQPVRMDSQAKYAALVRGDEGGGVYLRLPVAFGKNDDSDDGGGGGGGYQEKIWVRAHSHFAKFKKNGLVLYVSHTRRTTRLGRSSSKRPAASSRIIVGVRSILALGARSVGILVLSRRGRRSMRKWSRSCRLFWRNRRRYVFFPVSPPRFGGYSTDFLNGF